jgi:general secretion pathway protein E
MAQRLVRRLDDTTKQAYLPDQPVLERLDDIIQTLPPQIIRPDISTMQLFRPGSSPDNPYGYRGQIALREQFVMNDQIRALLEQGGRGLSAHDIEAAAIQAGMRTMLQDGVV